MEYNITMPRTSKSKSSSSSTKRSRRGRKKKEVVQSEPESDEEVAAEVEVNDTVEAAVDEVLSDQKSNDDAGDDVDESEAEDADADADDNDEDEDEGDDEDEADDAGDDDAEDDSGEESDSNLVPGESWAKQSETVTTKAKDEEPTDPSKFDYDEAIKTFGRKKMSTLNLDEQLRFMVAKAHKDYNPAVFSTLERLLRQIHGFRFSYKKDKTPKEQTKTDGVKVTRGYGGRGRGRGRDRRGGRNFRRNPVAKRWNTTKSKD